MGLFGSSPVEVLKNGMQIHIKFTRQNPWGIEIS